jgi:hypothetical protein
MHARESLSLLKPAEAAELLKLSLATLSTWRSRRGRVARDGLPGPPFVRLGRAIRYRPEDLAAWITAQSKHSFDSRGDSK